MDLIFEVEKLISYSPKREILFLKKELEMSSLAPNLRLLCPTRWTVRTAAVDSILQNYETLQEVLHDIREHPFNLKEGGLWFFRFEAKRIFFSTTTCRDIQNFFFCPCQRQKCFSHQIADRIVFSSKKPLPPPPIPIPPSS